MQLVELYKDDPSPQIYVRSSVPADEYVTKIRQAKFCPVCGGFSQVSATECF